MSNFQDLQDRVKRRVIDLPSSVLAEVPTLIQEAHRDIQRRHNFRVMRAKTAQLTTTLATRVLVAQPSDWKEARDDAWYVENLGKTRKVKWAPDREELEAQFGEDTTLDVGPPQFLLESEPTDDNDTTDIEVWPYPDGLSDYPDGEYRIVIPYWKFLPKPANLTDEDWFTNNGEEVLIRLATSAAFFLDWDEERGTLWLQRAEVEFQKLRKFDKMRVLSKAGGTLTPHWRGVNEPRLRG